MSILNPSVFSFRPVLLTSSFLLSLSLFLSLLFQLAELNLFGSILFSQSHNLIPLVKEEARTVPSLLFLSTPRPRHEQKK